MLTILLHPHAALLAVGGVAAGSVAWGWVRDLLAEVRHDKDQ